jgi:hypothetical protein
MIARNGRPLLELSCRGKYLVFMLASKNLILCNYILFATAFLFIILLA